MAEVRRRKVVRLLEGELKQASRANHASSLTPSQTSLWAKELRRWRGGLDLGMLAALVGHTTHTISRAFDGTCQDIQVYRDLRRVLAPNREKSMDSMEEAWQDGDRAKVGEWLREVALERFGTVTAAKRAIGPRFGRSPQWVHTVFKGMPRAQESYAMVAATLFEDPPSWLISSGSEYASIEALVPTEVTPPVPPDVDFEAYGSRLRDDVKRLGWTWTQTGDQLGRSRSYIGKLFLGRIEELAPYEQLDAALRSYDASDAQDPTLTEDEASEYAERVRARISELGWTQRSTAEYLDIPFNTFKKMLRGARTRRRPYEEVVAALDAAIPATPAEEATTLEALYAPPFETPALARLRVRALASWPSGDLEHVGTWLRATLEAGLRAGTSRHRASKELAARADHSIFWVTSRLAGKVRSPEGYDTLASLLGLSLEPSPERESRASRGAPVLQAVEAPRDVALDHQQTLMQMIQDLTQTVTALHARVEQLEGRPAWADELIEQIETPAPAPLTMAPPLQEEEPFDDLAIEAAASHPQGTLLYRTDGEVFLITHAGKAYVATETFGLPLDEDLPKWNPSKKKR